MPVTRARSHLRAPSNCRGRALAPLVIGGGQLGLGDSLALSWPQCAVNGACARPVGAPPHLVSENPGDVPGPERVVRLPWLSWSDCGAVVRECAWVGVLGGCVSRFVATTSRHPGSSGVTSPGATVARDGACQPARGRPRVRRSASLRYGSRSAGCDGDVGSEPPDALPDATPGLPWHRPGAICPAPVPNHPSAADLPSQCVGDHLARAAPEHEPLTCDGLDQVVQRQWCRRLQEDHREEVAQLQPTQHRSPIDVQGLHRRRRPRAAPAARRWGGAVIGPVTAPPVHDPAPCELSGAWRVVAAGGRWRGQARGERVSRAGGCTEGVESGVEPGPPGLGTSGRRRMTCRFGRLIGRVCRSLPALASPVSTPRRLPTWSHRDGGVHAPG